MYTHYFFITPQNCLICSAAPCIYIYMFLYKPKEDYVCWLFVVCVMWLMYKATPSCDTQRQFLFYRVLSFLEHEYNKKWE
jgi:hypothetical protein